jgi:hypothetical protein
MTNKSVSDFVAATMNAVLESDEHKSLFGSTYKTASFNKKAEDDTICKCGYVYDGSASDHCPKCSAPNPNKSKADDNSAKDGSSENDSCMEDDADDNSAKDGSSDMSSTALDIAIDGLLTASAALDSVGFSKTSALSLRIASLVVEAKKKEKAKKDEKKSGKKDEKSSKKPPFGKKDDKKGKSSSTSSSSSAKKPAKKDEKSSSTSSKKK